MRTRQTLCWTANCVVALLLLGCYPRPHDFTRMPAITGVLVSAGKPVTGVNVYAAQNQGNDGNYCRDMRLVATTDSNGAFQVGPIIERHFFASLINPPELVFQQTSICFEVSTKQYLGLTVVSSTFRPNRFAAACDLVGPTQTYLSNVSVPGNPLGICSNPEESFHH